MAEHAVTWSSDGAIHRIRLTNPDRYNPLIPESVTLLREALAAGERSRVVVVSSEGKHFCAGGDHAAIELLNHEEFSHYILELTGLFEDLAAYPVPIVGAVQGAAIGGGFQLALQFDFVVAAQNASFALPQVGIGIPLSEMIYANLRARTGLGFTRRLILLGERIDAATALAHGIVDELVPPGDLEQAAGSVAERLASRPRGAIAGAREVLRRGFPRQEGISYERQPH